MNRYGGSGVGVIKPTQKQKPASTPPVGGVTGAKPKSSVRAGGDLRTGK